jgi:hypothetical protein
MSESRFKVSAWTPDGNHVEEELGEFANLVVATVLARIRGLLRQPPDDAATRCPGDP